MHFLNGPVPNVYKIATPENGILSWAVRASELYSFCLIRIQWTFQCQLKLYNQSKLFKSWGSLQWLSQLWELYNIHCTYFLTVLLIRFLHFILEGLGHQEFPHFARLVLLVFLLQLSAWLLKISLYNGQHSYSEKKRIKSKMGSVQFGNNELHHTVQPLSLSPS